MYMICMLFRNSTVFLNNHFGKTYPQIRLWDLPAVVVAMILPMEFKEPSLLHFCRLLSFGPFWTVLRTNVPGRVVWAKKIRLIFSCRYYLVLCSDTWNLCTFLMALCSSENISSKKQKNLGKAHRGKMG